MNISKTNILGDTLTLREWKPTTEANSEAVILLHGIESHSEWFKDIAEKLCTKGYSVLAYDRAGWGLSEGKRGHIELYNHILKQLTTISSSLRATHSKVHLVGLSWGGMFALYATLRRSIFFDSLSMIAPGIFPAATFPLNTKIRITTAIIARNNEKDFPLPIKLDAFTNDSGYKKYISSDSLRNTTITTSAAFETFKMQQFCKTTTLLRRLPPTTLLLGSEDTIINNKLTKDLFSSQDISIEEYPAKQHSLIFEDLERTLSSLLRNFNKSHEKPDTQKYRILVMGAGAVGSITGGYLALGGNQVTLVGRKKHVDAINNTGLCIRLGGVERNGIKAGLDAVENISQLTHDYDLVIISVKSFDTTAVLEELTSVIKPETTILSLQNGVSNEVKIHKFYPKNTLLAGIICMNLNFSSPGCIECTDDKGGISIGLFAGSSSNATRAITALRTSGLQVDYSAPDSTRIKWSKMLLNISSNVLNAITGLSYKEILADKYYGTLAVNAINETFAIMRKEGIAPIRLPGYNVEALAKLCKAPNFVTRQVLTMLADDSEKTVTSMQQDLSKVRKEIAVSGKIRPTEISELNGKIVSLGEKYNIPTPANAALCKMLEEQQSN